MDWQILWQYRAAFLYGALTTLGLMIPAVVFGTILGGALMFARRSHNPIARFLAIGYIWFLRPVPFYTILLWVYYAFPELITIRLPAFIAAFLALMLNMAAFVSENMRAAIEAVPRDQFEAAFVDGASEWQAMWHIVLPQGVRIMIPSMINEFITSGKLTSITAIIGVGELMNRAGAINASVFKPLGVYTMVAIVYFVIFLPLMIVAELYEGKLAAERRKRPTANGKGV